MFLFFNDKPRQLFQTKTSAICFLDSTLISIILLNFFLLSTVIRCSTYAIALSERPV